MVATVADVLTLAEAKRQLGVMADVTDFDERIQDCIDQAVSFVSRQAGVPLVNEERQLGFEASGTEPGRIMLPLGWPAPTQVFSFRYIVTRGSMTASVTAEPGASAYQEEVGGDWLVRPADFMLTSWPTNFTASIRLNVGMASIPERIVAAVVIACRALYRNEDLPTQAVGDLLA